MRGLRPVDRFQIITTGLILVLGATILVRAALRGAPLDSYGLGGAFVAYGLYRVRLVLRGLRGNRVAP